MSEDKEIEIIYDDKSKMVMVHGISVFQNAMHKTSYIIDFSSESNQSVWFQAEDKEDINKIIDSLLDLKNLL